MIINPDWYRLSRPPRLDYSVNTLPVSLNFRHIECTFYRFLRLSNPKVLRIDQDGFGTVHSKSDAGWVLRKLVVKRETTSDV
jgi:hypothetical protein